MENIFDLIQTGLSSLRIIPGVFHSLVCGGALDRYNSILQFNSVNQPENIMSWFFQHGVCDWFAGLSPWRLGFRHLPHLFYD